MVFSHGAAREYPEGLVRHVQEFAAVLNSARRRNGETAITLTPQGLETSDSDSRLLVGRVVGPGGACKATLAARARNRR